MATVTGSTIQLSAADVTWGRRQRTCVALLSQSAGSYDGTYFTIEAPSSISGPSVSYYVWFDLDNASVDPAPGGTGIEVDVTTGDAASAIATALAAAVGADANFRAIVDPSNNAQVLIDSEFIGKVDNDAADNNTTLDIQVTSSGIGGDLGKTSGGIEIAIEQEKIDITADQTGGIILDSVIRGAAVSVTMSLLEMTPERWENVVGSVSGDVFTPPGGTQLVGFGESRVYQSLFELGGELVLHPTRRAASDRSYDVVLWKSAPVPSSYNFSGEDPTLLEVEFVGLANREVESAINILAFGDNQQDVRI
jgi:hypothetical protein